MIYRREIKSAWIDYWCLMLNWTSLSILAFFSTTVIWAFVLKHYLGVKQEFWVLNDTKDGDYGDPAWLEENNLKPGLWSAFNWWWRNHSWNWIRVYNPPWKGGDVDIDRKGNPEFLVLKNTLNKIDPNYGKWTRANHRKGIYGTNYIAYRINGRVCCQWSKTFWKLLTIQVGAGGSEYRFRFKP